MTSDQTKTEDFIGRNVLGAVSATGGGEDWVHEYIHEMKGSRQAYQREVAKVIAWEQVRVPAGTFWAYRIEAKNAWVGRGVADETYWYAPEVGFTIKYASREFRWEYELAKFNK